MGNTDSKTRVCVDEVDFRKRLSAVIKMAREVNLLTQTQLAEKAGVSLKNVSRIETGRMIPSLMVAFKLAQALGITVDDLVGNKYDDPPEVPAVLHMLRDASPEGRARGLRVLRECLR